MLEKHIWNRFLTITSKIKLHISTAAALLVAISDKISDKNLSEKIDFEILNFELFKYSILDNTHDILLDNEMVI